MRHKTLSKILRWQPSSESQVRKKMVDPQSLNSHWLRRLTWSDPGKGLFELRRATEDTVSRFLVHSILQVISQNYSYNKDVRGRAQNLPQILHERRRVPFCSMPFFLFVHKRQTDVFRNDIQCESDSTVAYDMFLIVKLRVLVFTQGNTKDIISLITSCPIHNYDDVILMQVRQNLGRMKMKKPTGLQCDVGVRD